MKGLKPEELHKLINLPEDAFSVKHLELFYNESEDRLYCLLEAPNEEAILKHHETAGFRCEFVTQVRQIKTERELKMEKLALLGEMSSRINHDLRNPLSIIKNSIDLLKTHQADPDANKQHQFSRIEHAINQMNAIINDMMNFARTQPLDLKQSSLIETIRNSAQLIQIPENVSLILPEKDIVFSFDSAKMEVVFYNLIINAIHAIGKEKGLIMIRFNEKNNEKIVIEVQDSGSGIPDDLIGKVFEPLFSTKKYGTGLGLASCKAIVEQHKGIIYVKNSPTTFTIVLPKSIKDSILVLDAC